MSIPLRITFAVATLSFAVLVGCGPRIEPPVEPRADPHGWPQVQVTDRTLAGNIVLRQPQVTTDEAGLLFITVPVRSTTRHQLTIEYRVTFFDRNRVPIQETTWFPRTLSAFTQDTISVNSTSPRADDFQLDIRPAK